MLKRMLIILSLLLICTSCQKENETVVIKRNIEYADKYLKDIYEENLNKAYFKDDYKFELIFKSNLIDVPVVQGESNDTYLRKDYKTYDYKVEGTPFIDFTCDLNNDQNIIIYGHSVNEKDLDKYDPNFTYLHKLKDYSNFEDNKEIMLVYKDKVDFYVISNVYTVDVVEIDNKQYVLDSEPKYYLNNYSNKEFIEYINLVNERSLYKTGIDIDNKDSLLTLQTCFMDNPDKLIVLAKKLYSLEYE